MSASMALLVGVLLDCLVFIAGTYVGVHFLGDSAEAETDTEVLADE